MSISQIALIGFGEVGQILGADLTPGHALSAWDVKFDQPNSVPSRAIENSTVRRAASAGDAIGDVTFIISAVTAEQTTAAAQSAAANIKPGAIYLDMNSASPLAKSTAAQIINDAGGRYIEAAVMSPFPPKRLATPVLLGGAFAQNFEETAHELGFSGAAFYAHDYGKAAAAKMCRSAIVKGVEALLTEALLSARKYGVQDSVISSLHDLFPGPDWATLSRYMISRSLIHGERRAEEMREVARTVNEAGLAPYMSVACAERQDWAAQFASAAEEAELVPMLDSILRAFTKQKGPRSC